MVNNLFIKEKQVDIRHLSSSRDWNDIYQQEKRTASQESKFSQSVQYCAYAKIPRNISPLSPSRKNTQGTTLIDE